MKQTGPLPKTMELAKTLAQRIYQLREFRNLTKRDLAKATKFSVSRIEDIETGMETWFSSADRQRLAKALTIEPALIEEVENKYEHYSSLASQQTLPESIKIDLTSAILAGDTKLNCPLCGQSLISSIQHGLDIDEQPVRLARAYCSKCPFVLR